MERRLRRFRRAFAPERVDADRRWRRPRQREATGARGARGVAVEAGSDRRRRPPPRTCPAAGTPLRANCLTQGRAPRKPRVSGPEHTRPVVEPKGGLCRFPSSRSPKSGSSCSSRKAGARPRSPRRSAWTNEPSAGTSSGQAESSNRRRPSTSESEDRSSETSDHDARKEFTDEQSLDTRSRGCRLAPRGSGLGPRGHRFRSVGSAGQPSSPTVPSDEDMSPRPVPGPDRGLLHGHVLERPRDRGRQRRSSMRRPLVRPRWTATSSSTSGPATPRPVTARSIFRPASGSARSPAGRGRSTASVPASTSRM